MQFGIVTTCFNNRDTITEAIESVLHQDYPEFKYYICDNGSTDGSAEKIRAYSDPRISATLHTGSLPKTENWNRAYAIAENCRYIVMLHGDDILAKGALLALRRATKGNPAFVHGRFKSIQYNGAEVSSPRFPLSYRCAGERFQELLAMGNIVSVVGATVRSDVFRACGGWDNRWTYVQDVELWWKAASFGTVHYTGDLLGYYRAQKVDYAARHMSEYILWLSEKLEQVDSNRLGQAAVDGLAEAIRIAKQYCLSGDETAAPLRTAVGRGQRLLLRIMTTNGLTPRPNVLNRQRARRIIMAAKWMVGRPVT